MKVIVILGKKRGKRAHLMLELSDQKTIDETKRLINAWKCSQAIAKIVRKGRFIRKIKENEIANVASDLIVSGTNAHWSLI